MKFALGFAAGVAAAWAALAIWQRVPEFPLIDADIPPVGDDAIDRIVYHRGRPRFDDAAAL